MKPKVFIDLPSIIFQEGHEEGVKKYMLPFQVVQSREARFDSISKAKLSCM